LILALLKSAQEAGARLESACEVLGISLRTVQRWKLQEGGEDSRSGPLTPAANALSRAERERILEVMNSPEFRGLPPTQVVPILADRGEYIGSESTIYRVLRQEAQVAHWQRSRPPTPRKKPRHEADGPNQLWSWDITYLHSAVRGNYYYLYLMLDVWSRKIVGWEVHSAQSAEHAAALVEEATKGLEAVGLVLHADNGGPMKGATMLSTLQRLGVIPSFSRPQVSDDNPFSEAAFRTLKYRPGYPVNPFASLEEARAWIASFVAWYNEDHRHSGIAFLTPAQRHAGQGPEILARRRAVYEEAKTANPNRWACSTRAWKEPDRVFLNPNDQVDTLEQKGQANGPAVDPNPTASMSRRLALAGQPARDADRRSAAYV
tara:strand:+ start:599 stop:1726 length:1128 start_codon:yes stop_codon:yes gene_type:complete